MKILDRYVFLQTASRFGAALFICSLLLLVGRVFDKLGDILEAGDRVSIDVAARYLLMSLPFELAQVMPLVATLSALLVIAKMARDKEIVAILSGGVSVWRLAVPVCAFGLAVAALTWALGEYVVPEAQAEARRLERYIDGKEPRNRNEDIVATDSDNATMYIETYVRQTRPGKEDRERMDQATIWKIDPESWRLRWRVDASDANFEGESPDGAGTVWSLGEAIEHSFSGDGKVASRTIHQDDLELELGNSLNLYLRAREKPEEMNFAQLSRYVSILEDRGDHAGAYRTDLNLKIAFPLGIALLTLIAYACGLRAHMGSYMGALSAGIVAAVIYFFTTAIMQALGRASLGLPPEAFAWFTNAAFLVVAVVALARAGRAR